MDRIAPVATEEATDGELVARAAEGDGSAFELLMRRHNQLLFRTARSILRNDAEAEDALQDAYLRAWRALGSFRSQSRLSTWLVRIVTNEALGRLRRTRPQVIPLESAMTSPDHGTQAALTDALDQGPEPSAIRAQVRQMMEARIDGLPDAYRTVFMLRGVEELSVDEVAQALDVPAATVRSRFFRARGLLRQGLASDLDTPLDEVFAFDGARCDRLVAAVMRRAEAEGLRRET
jgi:RNA polymerase sigma-70 factor (ECF subfamily)